MKNINHPLNNMKPTQDLIQRANLHSRDIPNQPLLKLNVGQGNSFIVKNSNIVITQNTINKAIVNGGGVPQANFPLLQGSMHQQQADKVFSTSFHNGMPQQKAKSPATHQRAYSFE